MQSFLSIITAGTMMFSVNAFSQNTSVDSSSGEKMTTSQDRINARKLRATEERSKSEGQWATRWVEHSDDVKRMPMRHRVNGTVLRCIQIAEKTRVSPGPSCERLKDYTRLLDNCAADMNTSPYCMPAEQQVVDRAAAKSAASASSASAE